MGYSNNAATKSLTSVIVLIFITGLLVGGLASFFISFNTDNNSDLQAQIDILQAQLSDLEGVQNTTYQNITIYQDESSLAEIYAKVKDSVVLIQGITQSGSVQGSGFVYSYKNQYVIITNYHVVQSATSSLSVTFQSGNGYPATVLGADPYADLAIVSVNAPSNEFKALKITSSSSLRVGEPVIAIGNPYGLVGSLTTGVISALGRTITEDSVNRFSIANVIQTNTPINPGNSGGPMLNAAGEVIGISTAIVLDSQGLAFAIPSNTILREISAIISTGTYHGHSYLGVNGNDMNYNAAQQLGTSITYGWRIAAVVKDGPSDGKLQEGDIIIALNNVKIKNNDDLASYLEEKTLPGQTINITVMRNNTETNLTVTLKERPPITT